MALKEITEHILSDSQVKVEEIKKAAKEKARAILDEAREKANHERERLLVDARKRADEEKKRMIAIARLQARSAILSAKQNQVEKAFRSALHSLVTLSDEEYRGLFKKLLRKAVKGGEEVIVSERDRRRISSSLLAEVNSTLKLSEEIRDMEGGFILKAGRIETNSSFSALISTIREEMEPKIVEVLFGE